VQVLHYPHPTLLRAAKPLTRVDGELRRMVGQMFELMYEHDGIGLAGPQVDLPYRIFVVNETGDPKQQEHEHVFINPVLSKPKGTDEKEEGCLSLPKLYAPVRRPTGIHAAAYNLKGELVTYDAEGLLARVIQHENDHLDGVMFIDRISQTALIDVKDQLEEFRDDFERRRQLGEIPDDAKIFAHLAELEKLRT